MTRAPVVLLHNGDGGVASSFEASVAAGDLRWLRQSDVTADDLGDAQGLILPLAVDQIALMELKPALEALLDRGGRIAMMCHMLRPFIDGPGIFVPMDKPKRPDFNLIRLRDHVIFDGVPTEALESNKGVVGFYGRGHNPMPEGAEPIQVFGERQAPVDWIWERPKGGTVFNHSGNDLWVVGNQPDARKAMAPKLVAWCKGEI
jgi:hypothetical protein